MGRTPRDLFGGPPTFRITLQLYDAPLVGANAGNAQFNAGILGVDAIDSLGDSWQLIANDAPNVVNLLALQNASLVLGDGTLPAGTYPSVQLLLDPATTTVTYNGQTYPVRFTDPNHPWWDPAQTIEAVNVPLQVSGDAGQTVGATLDFNVFESANLADGVVYLTPTVAGGVGSPTIAGNVANAAGQPVANATVIATGKDGTVANTTFTAADGSFHLRGINPGGYTISVVNTFTTKAGVTITASGADDGASPSTYAVVGPDTQLTLATLRD
ncbi:MAG TPA: carboxypeptidase regulatory-like domain-containing protein [Candidatus Elarobacter sp.]